MADEGEAMKPIDRRLRELQQELQEPPHLLQGLHQAGLVAPLLGFIAGILLQHTLKAPPVLWLSGLVLQLPLGRLLRRYRQRQNAMLIYALSAFLVLGGLRTLQFNTSAPDDIRHIVTRDEQLVALRGTVSTPPQIHFDTEPTPLANPLSPATTFCVRVQALEGPTRWQPACGSVYVRVGEPMPSLAWGDRVELYGQLAPVRPATNPGQLDRARALAYHNITGMVTVKTTGGVVRQDEEVRGLWRWLRRVPAPWARSVLLRGFREGTPHTGLLQALVLGDRTQIASRTYDAFAHTGLLHLISLSGLHVGLLLALVWRLGRHLGLLKPGRALLSLVTLFLFLLVVPPRPPTVRAVVIGTVFCLGILLRRHARPWHSLACAALLLLLIRPTQLFEPGWQLSFACVAGILLWTPPLRRLFERQSDTPAAVACTAPGLRAWFRRTLQDGVTLLCVGASAYLGGAGILLAHFYTVTPLACLWTVLVLPLIALLLNAGFLKLILAILPGVHVPWALVITGILGFTTAVVHVLADLSPRPLVVGATPSPVILAYYLLLLGLTLWYRHHPRAGHRPWVGAALLIVTWTVIGSTRHRRAEGLVLTCLDVGHGQALVLQVQDQVIMLDAGSLYHAQAGRSIILPFLNHQGLPVVHALVLSHHDSDHINAVPQLTRYGRVKRLLAPAPMLTRIEELGEESPLRERQYRRPPLEILPRSLPLGYAARLERLWPPPAASERLRRSDNNSSAVLLLHYAGRRILFCSDIEAQIQAELLDLYPDLRVDVLVLPHHGSLKTLHAGFIPRLNPSILLVSCTRSQFREDRVLSVCPGREVWLTARDGAIAVTIDRQGHLQAQPWLMQAQ
jgi:competence protein ComEC